MTMRHPTILAPKMVAKLEADHASRRRVKTALDEDFPYPSHLHRNWIKRAALLEAQNHRCAYCGIGLIDGGGDDEPSVDEVMPRALGGLAIWSNQVMACRLCNTARGVIDATVYLSWVLAHGRFGAVEIARRHQSMVSKRAAKRPRNRVIAAALEAAGFKA